MANIYKIAFGYEKRPMIIGAVEIPCYILENEQSVFLKAGIQKALGYDGKSEQWLPDLLNSIHKFSPVPESIIFSYENPILFEIIRPDRTSQIAEGIVAKNFLDICKVIVMAKKDGYLNVNQLRFSKAAENILSVINENTIDAQIAEATGFQFFKETTKEHLQHIIAQKLNDTAFIWSKTLPEPFFEALFAIHDFDWLRLKKQPLTFGKILYEVVFSRISNDLLEKLRKNLPKRVYSRKNNIPQDIQHPELKEYIASVHSLLKAAEYNWNIFLQLLNRAHPKNSGFTTRFPVFSENAQKEDELSPFNKILKRVS